MAGQAAVTSEAHAHAHEGTIPAKAFFGEQPCQLADYHKPHPVMTEFHHQKPVFLQNRLYGKIVYGPSLWVCANCHEAIHAWLYYLLGEHREPPYIGRLARLEAEKTYQWYLAEKARLGK